MSSDGNIIDPKASKFSKIQIKALQEAMYLSAENGHLGKNWYSWSNFMCLFQQK